MTDKQDHPNYDCFKMYIQGQPDDHVMDWLGCNFHVVTVTGQPRHGFDLAADAQKWWNSLGNERQQAELDRAQDMEGTHLSDYR